MIMLFKGVLLLLLLFPATGGVMTVAGAVTVVVVGGVETSTAAIRSHSCENLRRSTPPNRFIFKLIVRFIPSNTPLRPTPTTTILWKLAGQEPTRSPRQRRLGLGLVPRVMSPPSRRRRRRRRSRWRRIVHRLFAGYNRLAEGHGVPLPRGRTHTRLPSTPAGRSGGRR